MPVIRPFKLTEVVSSREELFSSEELPKSKVLKNKAPDQAAPHVQNLKNKLGWITIINFFKKRIKKI